MNFTLSIGLISGYRVKQIYIGRVLLLQALEMLLHMYELQLVLNLWFICGLESSQHNKPAVMGNIHSEMINADSHFIHSTNVSTIYLPDYDYIWEKNQVWEQTVCQGLAIALVKYFQVFFFVCFYLSRRSLHFSWILIFFSPFSLFKPYK